MVEKTVLPSTRTFFLPDHLLCSNSIFTSWPAKNKVQLCFSFEDLMCRPMWSTL